MTNHADEQARIQEPHYSFLFRLRLAATIILLFWIVAAVLSHAVMAVRMLGDHRPHRIEYSFGFPAVRTYTPPGRPLQSGSVAPSGPTTGVTPGSGPTTGDTPDVSITVTCTDDPNRPQGPGCNTCSFMPGWLEKILGRIGITIPESLCWIVFILVLCFFIMVLFAALLEWVCSSEWVRDESIARRCRRRKCKWWCLCCNKWLCWLEVFVQWLMRQICSIAEVLAWILFAICVIAGVILYYMYVKV